MILVIDNYDSFVHNLARYIERLGVATRVVRNDAISIDEVTELAPQAIVLSPGPCTPDQAGCSLKLVKAFYQTVPMLGVCLGHQAIAEALGGKVIRSNSPWHGRSSEIEHTGDGVFAGLPSPMSVGRYHSLVVEPRSLPDELAATAWADGRATIMAVMHQHYPVVGLQFHPESILTQHGYQLLGNFLKLAGVVHRGDCEALARQERMEPSRKWVEPDQPVTF